MIAVQVYMYFFPNSTYFSVSGWLFYCLKDNKKTAGNPTVLLTIRQTLTFAELG